MGASGALKRRIQKNNVQPPPQEQPMPEQQGPPAEGAMAGAGGGIGDIATQMADPAQSGQVDEGAAKQVEDLTAMYLNLIHSKETEESVMETLSAQDNPAEAVSTTANMIMSRVEAGAKKKKTEIPNAVKVASAQYLVMELVNLGNAAGVFNVPVTEEDVPDFFRKTVEDYMSKGLREGTLDPVQLQIDLESLMTDEQKQAGVELGEKAGGGLPPGPTPQMAVDRRVQGAVQKEQQKTAAFQQEAQALKGAMRGGGQ